VRQVAEVNKGRRHNMASTCERSEQGDIDIS